MYASEVNFPVGISKNFEIQKSVKWMSGNPLVSQSVRFQTPGVSKYMLTRSDTLPRPFRVRGYAARSKNPLLSESVRECPVVGTRKRLVRIGLPERSTLVFVPSRSVEPFSRYGR
jgi:hypothetical protein